MTTELTQQAIDNQIKAALTKQTEQEKTEPKACRVWYKPSERKIAIEFENGCQFECPISLLQGVSELPDDEIAKVKLTPAGWGINWEEADLDFDVSGLINGIFGTKAWMKKIAAKEGRQKNVIG